MERIARFFQIKNLNSSIAGVLICSIILLGVVANFIKFYGQGKISNDYSFLFIHTGLSVLLVLPVLIASIWSFATQAGRDYLERVSKEPRTKGIFWFLKAIIACSILGNITFFSLWMVALIIIGREVIAFPFSTLGQWLILVCVVIWVPVVWKRLN